MPRGGPGSCLLIPQGSMNCPVAHKISPSSSVTLSQYLGESITSGAHSFTEISTLEEHLHTMLLVCIFHSKKLSIIKSHIGNISIFFTNHYREYGLLSSPLSKYSTLFFNKAFKEF